MTGRVLTVPNLLTALRGLAAAPIAWAILAGEFRVAIVLVVLAGLTDGVDGYVARHMNQQSDVGRILDPIADKVLLVTILLASTTSGRGFEPLPAWFTAADEQQRVYIAFSEDGGKTFGEAIRRTLSERRFDCARGAPHGSGDT